MVVLCTRSKVRTLIMRDRMKVRLCRTIATSSHGEDAHVSVTNVSTLNTTTTSRKHKELEIPHVYCIVIAVREIVNQLLPDRFQKMTFTIILPKKLQLV